MIEDNPDNFPRKTDEENSDYFKLSDQPGKHYQKTHVIIVTELVKSVLGLDPMRAPWSDPEAYTNQELCQAYVEIKKAIEDTKDDTELPTGEKNRRLDILQEKVLPGLRREINKRANIKEEFAKLGLELDDEV